MQNLTGDVLKVSVIIPVFNGERFIGEAIQSVMDQTYPPLEIIVVDDGSSDKTADIVRYLSGARPILYRRQSNQGAAAARNAGVSLAQGEWIAFLDADDVWYPEKLAIQVEHFKTYPDVPFFYSDMDIIDDEGKDSGEKEPKRILCLSYLVTVPFLTHRRSCSERTSLRNPEDSTRPLS